MHFEYSTLTSPNPVSQPLISRFYVHHDTPCESPKALTTDSYLTPDSGACTHSGRHLWQAPLPCQQDPQRSLATAPFSDGVIPPLPRHRRG